MVAVLVSSGGVSLGPSFGLEPGGGAGFPGGSPRVRLWHRSAVAKGGCGVCAAARCLGCWLGAPMLGACFRCMRSPRAPPSPTFLPPPLPAFLPSCPLFFGLHSFSSFLPSCPPTFLPSHLLIFPSSYYPPRFPPSYLPTWLIRKRPPLGPYRGPRSRVPGWSQGGGRFLTGEFLPLSLGTPLIFFITLKPGVE